MKKIVSLIAAIALSAFMTTSCGLTQQVATASPSASGTTTGKALLNLFTQYMADGKLDTGNISNLINLATIATSIQSLKGNSDNTSLLGNFAAGLVKGSNNTVTSANSSSITSILASLANTTDLSSLASLLTRSGEVDQQAAAQAQKSQAMASTTSALSNIFAMMSK
ncbi:MAG: hypothetical protein IJR25_05690 [Bacteroidales bacterium]|nr:hypothetical protein [Bacteroidales bacterium]